MYLQVNATCVDWQNGSPVYLATVSYTHLDVYKRQASGRAVWQNDNRIQDDGCAGTYQGADRAAV